MRDNLKSLINPALPTCQIDCKIGRHKVLALFLYDDHMGKGKVLFEHQNLKKDWRSTKPGSVGYSVLKEICDK